MSLPLAFGLGACLGIWLDIAIDRWGDALLDTYVGRVLAAVFEYLAGSLLLAWEFIRYDLPRLLRHR